MLEVRDLTIKFAGEDREFTAVDSLSFALPGGETLAMVGESGSGKSVTALSLTRLLPEPPARITSGDVLLDGESLFTKPLKALRRIRGKRIAYVFQEPGSSLNPVLSIYVQVPETIRRHRPEVKRIREEVIYWLDQVGTSNRKSAYGTGPFNSAVVCNKE